jgi:uncharacterized protein
MTSNGNGQASARVDAGRMFEQGDALWATLRWRGDSWQNLITGLGTSRDKTTYGRYARLGRIPDLELSALYHENDIAQRVVGLKPREMLRQGYAVNVPDAPDDAEAIAKAVRALGVNRSLRDGMTWGRLYGGCAVLIGADDGGRADQPLLEDRVRSLRFLEVIDRRYIVPVQAYGARDVEYFDVYPRRSMSFRIHASRLILFGGALTTDEERDCLGGWDHSVLHAAYEVVRAHDAAWKSGEHLLADASQAVFKMKGLLKAIAGGRQDEVRVRAEIADMGRSVLRALLLDSEGEEFSREPSSFTDAAKMVELFTLRLAAAAEMPVTILFGRSPQGMNATGDSDFRHFYDTVRTAQENELRPELERVLRLLMLAQDGPTGGKVPEQWAVKFYPLWQMTPKEQAELEKTTAETDAIYIDKQVVLPEEIATSRFKAEGWSSGTSIDLELRTRMLESEKTILEAGGDPNADPDADQPPAPNGEGEGAGIELAPTDIATIVRVREARKSVGLGPWGDPAVDEISLAEFRKLAESKGEGAGAEVGAAVGKEQAKVEAPAGSAEIDAQAAKDAEAKAKAAPFGKPPPGQEPPSPEDEKQEPPAGDDELDEG